MGQLLAFASPSAADAAWEDYRALAQEAIDRPALMVDREHCQAVITAHDRFKRAFLAQGRG